MFKSISEEQAGFGRGYSTIDNAFILYNRQRLYRLQYTTPLSFTIDNAFFLQSVINKYLSKKRGKLYVAYVDFRTAYDSIQLNIKV